MERQKQSRACSLQCLQFAAPPPCSPFTERPSIINAPQLNKWDPNLHISALLEGACLPPPSHPNASTSPDPSHLIFINSVTGVLMLFKVTLGRASAVWSPAKQKFTASATDPALRHAGKESDEVCEGFGGRKKRLPVREDALRRNG